MLNPGTDTRSFDISGNQRCSADDSMVVTLGGLLDNVSLVPEPSTLALIGIALTSLIACRKKTA